MEHTGSQGAGEKAPPQLQNLARIQVDTIQNVLIYIFLGKGNCVFEKFAFKFEYNRTTAVEQRASPAPHPRRDTVTLDKINKRVQPRGSDYTELWLHQKSVF